MRTITLLLAAGLALPLPCQKTNPAPAAEPTNEIDYDGFRAAYDKAEAPLILVVCGIAADPGSRGQLGQKSFRLFDSSGDSDVLRSSIERALLNGDADVVSPQDLGAAQQRQVQAMVNQGDAQGAIRQMQTLLNAEVAITVWMLPTRGSYRVTVDTTSLSRGAKIGTFAFDWKLGNSAAEIKQYGQVMSRRLFDDFIRNYGRGNPAGSRFNVELFGVEDARQMKEIETAMTGVEGVQRVRSTGMTRDRNENLARFRVNFSGSRIDLMAAMEEIGSKILGGECRVSDGVGEAIVLRTSRPIPAPTVDPLFDFESPRGDAARAELKRFYDKHGRPTIAVLVNRAARSEGDDDKPETPREGGGKRGGIDAEQVIIMMSGGILDNAADSGSRGKVKPPADPDQPVQATEEQIDTRKVEDNFYNRLLKLKTFELVDVAVVRERLEQAAGKQTAFKEHELAELYRASSGVDILIAGVGRVDRSRRPAGISYTFRVHVISSGKVLAAETWGSDSLSGLDSSLEFVHANVADYVCPKLVRQMMQSWSPPNTLRVTLTSANSQREVFDVMDAFKKILDIDATFEKHEGRSDTGIGTFKIQYFTSYEELIKRLQELESQLPFDLIVTDTDRTSLSIKLKGS